MKKILKITALLLALILCLGMTTFADEVQADDSNTLAEIYAQNGAKATFVVNDAGEKTEQITVTYTDANNIKDGQFYLVVVLSGEDSAAVPTEDNILYMDQTVAAENSVSFSVYASSIEGRIEDSIILIYGANIDGESGNTLIAAIIKALYILGDVNGDDAIDILDAILIAQNTVGMPIEGEFNESAANVDGSEDIDILDAILIAQYTVGIITQFPGV